MAAPLNSIYIHIPFCKTKCNYCNFISYTNKFSLIKEYFDALECELSFYLKKFPGKNYKTIYIGGGTPSLIDACFYKKLLKTINPGDNTEITMEVNPGAVSAEYLKSIKGIGINRLSIGLQCFEDEILKRLNRLHSSKAGAKTVKDAKNAGFKNISIDLIYGLPGQTIESWEKTLYQAINLDIEHISAYGLKIEENTEFYKNPPENLPDEEINARMHLKTIEILEEKGFNQYEISNFSKQGFESKHNLAYWNNEEYLGIGAAAHGYINGTRYSNKEKLENYINNPLEKKEEKKLTEKEKIEEEVFLGLRLRKGIDLKKLNKKYSIKFFEKYEKTIQKYIKHGLMEFNGNKLKLTPEGALLSNNILADFL